jgi:CheY-like chemotaxis protein
LTLETCNSPQSSVLIVDESADCREVLSTLLRLRGVHTFEAAGARQGLDMLRRHQPSVVVLDLESDEADDETIRRQIDDQSRESQAAVIFLGVTSRPPDEPAEGHVIRKPYHYAPLIRTIEGLLER